MIKRPKLEIYKCIHEVNPMGNISHQEWKSVITNELDWDNSFVIYDKNQNIITYIFIFEGLDNAKEIGWVYLKNEEAKKCLLTQFKSTLLSLERLGTKTITLEIDTTDNYTYDLVSSFVIHSLPSLITYRK